MEIRLKRLQNVCEEGARSLKANSNSRQWDDQHLPGIAGRFSAGCRRASNNRIGFSCIRCALMGWQPRAGILDSRWGEA